MRGDATLSAAGVLDLTRGAVHLDEMELLRPGELILGGARGNNSRVKVHGDATMDSAGALTIGRNRVGVEKLQRGGAGRLLLGQGDAGDTAYAEVWGDATLDSAARLRIGEAAVTSAHIKDGSIVASDVAPGAVGALHMARDSVATASLVDSAVTGEKIASQAVGLGELENAPAGARDAGPSSAIRVPLFAASTLNATGQSRVTLSLR